MTKARLDPTLVEAAFAALLEAGGADRTAVLEALCRARPGLRTELESLIAAHDAGTGLMVPLGEDFASPPADSDGGDHSPFDAGMRVGPFRLTACIAHGGMGDVYRAERVDGGFTQQVAVKFIAGRLRSPETIRRFLAERQILASLQHPNIVGLIDGGVTDDGLPYLVMEFVDGLPITKYCRDHGLSLRARLTLFRQLCDVVGFAHRHLVVHRDLKPANIFVTGDGAVMVLDFGVAKLLQSGAASATAHLLGPMTPNYASPEQFRGLPAATPCDVYALGVVLYELLTGVTPYDTTGRPVDEILQMVLERQPPRPSATSGAGVPFGHDLLRGDLDAVILKAMAKETDARYASVDDLSDDLLRYLEGRPVLAREPSLAYSLGKALGRHRLTFAAGGIALILLVATLLGAIWQARVAAAQRERAMIRFNDLRELTSALIFRIHDEVAPLPGSTPVRQSVIAEGLKFLERLSADAAGDPSLQIELARAYIRIGDVQGRTGDANLGNREAAIRSYQRARDLVAPLAAVDDTPFEVATALVDAQLRLASGKAAEGQPEARAALEIAEKWHRLEPGTSRSMRLLARARFGMAATFGMSAESLPHWLEADRLFNAVLAREPGDLTHMRNAALTAKYLGTQFESSGQLDKANEYYGRASALDEARIRARPEDRSARLDLAIDISNLGSVREKRGEIEAATTAFQRSLEIREDLAASDPRDANGRLRVAFAHLRLAGVCEVGGDLASARRHAQSAVELYKPALPNTRSYLHAEYASALAIMAAVDGREGRRQSSCTEYRQALTSYALGEANGSEDRRIEVAAAVKACNGR